ncbi:MAG: hypothetical protein KBS64_02725 [Treponema sp.]|nr:hypothetical protein [Candidatus Treponema equi]
MKIIKFTAVASIALLLFSCASTPEVPAAPAVQEAEVTEPAEEIPQEEESLPAEEDVVSEDQEQIPEAADEISQEPQEEKEDKIVYEPIEDIQGYYESDPSPVFLEPMESTDVSNTADEKSPSDEELAAAAKAAEEARLAEEARIAAEAKTAEEARLAEEAKAAEEARLASEAKAAEANSTKVTLAPVEEPKNVYIQKPAVETPAAPSVKKKEDYSGIADAVEVESSELLSEELEGQEEKKDLSDSKIVIEPSRAVEMKNNQYLDIIYPGTGWIYLGEEDNKNSMRYFGRKIGESNTVFSLRSREEGRTILHFCKNDVLTGRYIDDYLQVDIKGLNHSAAHAVAPSYAEAVPSKPEKKVLAQVKDEPPVKEIPAPALTPAPSVAATQASAKKPVSVAQKATEKKPVPQPQVSAEPSDDSGTKTVIQNSNADNSQSAKVPQKTASKSENSIAQQPAETPKAIDKTSIQNTEAMSADEILEKAKDSFKNKKYQETLAYLDDFFSKATTKIDEGLMIQGQVFESNSSVRNIKSALDTYETIVRRYPQSIHWPKANERITYLRKFYFNIR